MTAPDAPEPARTGAPARLAGLLGTTEGHAQTLAIGLVLALALLLAGVPPVLRERIQEIALPGDASAPRPLDGPAAVADTAVTPAPPRGGAAPSDPRAPAAGPTIAVPDAPSTPTTAPSAPSGDPPPGTPPPETPPPCPASTAIGPAGDALDALRAELPVVPSSSLVLLFATLAGCDDEDPAILVFAAVAEMGGGVPDPGPMPALPAAPVTPPPELLEVLRPLAPQLQPVCETVGTSAVALALAFSTWPQAVSSNALGAVYDVLTLCAAIAPPEPPE